jgi:hypothetical protein
MPSAWEDAENGNGVAAGASAKAPAFCAIRKLNAAISVLNMTTTSSHL